MKSGLTVPKKQLVNLDFSYAKYFGNVSEFPKEDFIVADPLEVKDQGESFTCTAQAVTSVSEDQEGIVLESAYTWAKIRQIGGANQQGADPRDACKAACKYGFLPKASSPHSLEEDGEEFIANPLNWDERLDDEAYLHHKKAFFKADGQRDLFDSIMVTMWRNRSKKQSVFVGAYWQPWWNGVGGGVIPAGLPYDRVNPHAFKVYGMKIINDEPHAVILNSYGDDIGDGGTFYFPREVVNKFLFAYVFDDADSDDVKRSWNILQKIKYIVVKFLKKLNK